MMCLLALLTLLGGLFLLAYAKKEGLGKFTKLASYLAISFSTIVFIVGLIGLVACPATCGSGHCSKGMKQEKCIIIKKECKSGEKCEMDSKECHMKMEDDCKGGSCIDGSECSAELKSMNCDEACMKKCEKDKGACDGKCKN